MGKTVLNIFIWGGISSDIQSKNLFYGDGEQNLSIFLHLSQKVYIAVSVVVHLPCFLPIQSIFFHLSQ